MRQLYYTLLTLLRSRGSNMVCLVSLTLGLLVGVLLFSQIVYELNYDKAYREHERLALFCYRSISSEGQVREWDYDTWRPAAAALMESLPEQVECATPLFNWMQPDIYQDDQKLGDIQIVFGDTLYFRTMGIDVLKGDPQLLAQEGSLFLSQSKAHELFGTQDPVGKTLSMDKHITLTVRGIFKELPGNVSFPHNFLISLPTIENNYIGQGTWNSNDIYMIYVRLRHDVDLDVVNSRLNEVVSRYTPVENCWDGGSLECRLIPATSFYRESNDNMRRLIILSVLGFSIFFVSGMNYVLAVIATIGRRAKMVGVHKCCGADGGRVMALFLWETGIMMLVAIICSLLLMYLFHDVIEDMLGIPTVRELFTGQTLWAPALTVLLLFLLVGVLPGQLFARIPVTQVFRRYADDKRGWKRSLLFVQFAGVAFILGVLITSVRQYHDLMTRFIGFESDHLVVGQVKGGLDEIADGNYDRAVQYISDDLLRQPFVEAVGRSQENLLVHYSSTNLPAEGGSRYVHVHYQYFGNLEFPEAVGLELLQGSLPTKPGEALVGESLVRGMGWNDYVEGRELSNIPATPWWRKGDEWQQAKVTGVVRDVRNMGFFSNPTNVALIYHPGCGGTYHVRLKEPLRENLLRLNDYVKEVYPQTGLSFFAYSDVRRENNATVLRFRNTVYITSACILLIVLMGLIGYVGDETQRRSKEIAVRKVNGAESSDIIRLLFMAILRVAIGATLIGAVFAWYVSGVWMDQFADSTMLSPLWFVLLVLGLLVLILGVVVLKAWRIANENPVVSLKSE